MKKQVILLMFLLSGIIAKAQKHVYEDTSAKAPIFDRVTEKQASFPGGNDKFTAYLKQNSKYPLTTERGQEAKRVFVQFVVGKDGIVTNVHVVRGIGPELDSEAVRLIKASPQWIPGEQNGQKVKQQFTVQVPFAPLNTQTKEIRIDEPVDAGSNPSAVEHDTNEIFTVVQKSAAFPGGTDVFQKYLQKNSKYPIVADKVQTATAKRVFLGFVIEKDGTLTDIKIFRGASPELDAEAIRLIKASAPWLPGEQNGYKVRQQYVIPIAFVQK